MCRSADHANFLAAKTTCIGLFQLSNINAAVVVRLALIINKHATPYSIDSPNRVDSIERLLHICFVRLVHIASYDDQLTVQDINMPCHTCV